MALTFSSLTRGSFGNPIPSTSQNTASISPTANRLEVIDTVSLDTSGLNLGAPPSSITSSGLTWVNIDSQLYVVSTFNVYVSRWRAMGAAPGSGAVTINFATGQTDILWSVQESSSEVDTSGTNGSGAFVQTVKNTGTGTALTATLAAFGSTNNVGLAAFAADGSGTFTVGSGFTQLDNVDEALLTEYKLNDNTTDATYSTSVTWGAIASEIKAATNTYPGYYGKGGWF